MIERETGRKIRDLTLAHWQVEASTEAFMNLATGKEIGHRIADLVDETTTALLEKNFTTAREHSRSGGSRPRSMGDIWLLSNDIYNPINVKAGEANKDGQPNMVSLKKLVHALLDRQIDSYYLLFVKMLMQAGSIQPIVYLVDILDYLDFTAFDSGPGQIMLKERQFYDAMQRGVIPASLSLEEKIDKLIFLYEDAYWRLLKNRERSLSELRRKRSAFVSSPGQGIQQAGLHLR